MCHAHSLTLGQATYFQMDHILFMWLYKVKGNFIRVDSYKESAVLSMSSLAIHKYWSLAFAQLTVLFTSIRNIYSLLNRCKKVLS